MLKKLFLGIIALFFILAGGLFLLMGYVFNNPDRVFHAFTKMTSQFTKGEKYEESEEYLLLGIREVTLRTKGVSLEVIPYSGSTLKISIEGEVPRFERGPFLYQESVETSLVIDIHEPVASQWISMNMNGEELTHSSNVQLKAKIYYPETFAGNLDVITENGSVHLKVPLQTPFELSLNTQEGKIKNDVNADIYKDLTITSMGKISVLTKTGDISAAVIAQ